MTRDPDEGGDEAREHWLDKCDRGEACFNCGVSMTQIVTTGLDGLALFGCPCCGAHSFPIPAVQTPQETFR